MKARLDKLIILIAVCCCPLVVFSQYTLSGTVKNDKFLVMSETVVTLQQADSLVGMTLVDSKGRYKFTDLHKGKYTLSLSCPVFQVAGRRAIDHLHRLHLFRVNAINARIDLMSIYQD